MQKVAVYMSEDGLKVFPPVVILKRNETLRVINATGYDLEAEFPRGSVKKSDEKKPVPKRGKAEVEAGSPEEVTQYDYKVKTARDGWRAKGNSDPILIIEN